MALETTIPELDRKGLREFALVTGAIVAGLFGILLPWIFDFRFPAWPWILSGVLVIWGLLAPATLRPVYRTWMRFGLLLSRVTTPIILGMVFFLAVLPTALIVRLTRRDSMARQFDESMESYRVKSNESPPDDLEKPF